MFMVPKFNKETLQSQANRQFRQEPAKLLLQSLLVGLMIRKSKI
jgi:hypothetical protein